MSQGVVGALSPSEMSQDITGVVSPAQELAGSLIPRGNDGISPTVEITDVEGGKKITITDIYGVHTAIVKDGVDFRHEWIGTILEITSASGSSSVDLKGEKGDRGPQGIQGETGPQGERGIQGIQGIQGKVGSTGPQGIQGERGIQGEKGETGDVGPQGERGPQGVQGIQGEPGIQGIQGEQGPQGVQGPQGPEGPRGMSGVAIQATGYVAFNITEEGILQCSYTGDEQPNYYINEEGHLVFDM